MLDAETFRLFQQWLQQQSVPPYDVLSVSVDGEVEDERATLSVTVTFQVNRAEQWVLVPLRLREGFLLEPPQHTFQGKSSAAAARPDTPAFDPERGYRWWLKGEGTHTLKLRLSVPVSESRLRLSLPTPAAAASSARLKIRGSTDVSVNTPPQTSSRVRSQPGGALVELHGLGELLDVGWLAVPKRKPGGTELQATTVVLVEVGAESIVLEAYQTVKSVRGSFDRLSVRLPQGFDLLDVSGPDVESYSPPQKGVCQVLLSDATQEAHLKWILSASRVPEQDNLPAIRGFDVVGARRQSGYVGVLSVEGYRVERGEGEARFVHQTDVSDLQSLPELRGEAAAGQLSVAYRFLRQPFVLPLRLVRVRPYFSVEPLYFVRLTADRVEMEAVFRCQVYRGAIGELRLQWPRERPTEWTVSPPASAELVEEPGGKEGADRFVLRLLQPRSRVDGPFEVRLHAERPTGGSGGPVRLVLPTVGSSNHAPARVVFALADNVDAELIPDEDVVLAPLVEDQALASALPEFVRGLRRQVYRVDSRQLRFTAVVTAHSQQIRTQAYVRLLPQNGTLAVRERIEYQVAYERVSQARLVVPGALGTAVVFSLETPDSPQPVRATVSWSGSEVGEGSRVRVSLPEPLLGRFAVLADYTLRLPEGESGELTLPLVTSADAEFESVQVETSAQSAVRLEPSDPQWQQFATSRGTALFLGQGAVREVPLRVDRPKTRLAGQLLFTKLCVWSVFDAGGRARNVLLLQCEGPPQELSLAFPPGVAVEAFWWDDRRIPDQFVEVQSAEQTTQYRVDLRKFWSDQTTGHLLSLVYSSSHSDGFGWLGRHDFVFPQLPAGTIVGPTYWHVTFPVTHHLCSEPELVTALYRWQRSWLFWFRRSTLSREDLLRWIRTSESSATPAALPEPVRTLFAASYGNAYLFGVQGLPQTVSLWTMSRPMLVAVGAGLAFVLAVLFIKVSVLRNVLTLMGLSAAGAVAGVWFEEAFQLLLQPAVLGVLLAWAAAVMDNLVRARRLRGAVPLTPSEMAVSVSAVSREPTVVQPVPPVVNGAPPPAPSKPLSSPGTGAAG